VLFTDEAWFSLREEVNSQNNSAEGVNNNLRPFFAELTEQKSYMVFYNKILQQLIWNMQVFTHYARSSVTA